MSTFDQLRQEAVQHQIPAHVQLRREVPGPLRNTLALSILALSSGGVMFLAFGLLCIGFSWSVLVAIIASGVTIIVVWGWLFAFRTDDMFRLMWAIETATGRDFTQDGVIGPVVTVEVSDFEHRNMRRLDFPCEPEVLCKFARAIVSGQRTLAMEHWTGKRGPFSRGEYSDLLATLHERGMVEWMNPKAKSQGRQLTAYGREVFTEIATRTHMHASRGALPVPSDDFVG